MIIDQYLSQEQESREIEGIEAHTEQANKEVDFYSLGKFDAIIGGEPDPELAVNLSYRRGYQVGFWNFYDRSDLKYIARNIERIGRGEVFLLEYLEQFSATVLEQAWDILSRWKSPEQLLKCRSDLAEKLGSRAQFLLAACF